jgi:hypothetical protein
MFYYDSCGNGYRKGLDNLSFKVKHFSPKLNYPSIALTNARQSKIICLPTIDLFRHKDTKASSKIIPIFWTFAVHI